MSKILWSLVLAIAVAQVTHAEQEVRMLANTSPPYADAALPDQGLALELVKHIFSKTNYRPVITIENWSRAVEGARIGVYDGLASVWYSAEREKDLLFSEPYLRSELIILKLRSNPAQYSSLQEMRGTRIGVRSDYAYGVDFFSIPDVTLVQEDLLVPNLLNLLQKKVDLVIADQRTAALQLHALLSDRITEFEVVAIELPPVERYVAAARSWPGHDTMIAEFNTALAAAQRDGSLKTIIEKWDARHDGAR